jgi:hypothetical protein
MTILTGNFNNGPRVVAVVRLELTVRCDGCDKAGDSAVCGYAYVLRKNLRKLGWHNAGGLDLCPKCWRAEQESKRTARNGSEDGGR